MKTNHSNVITLILLFFAYVLTGCQNSSRYEDKDKTHHREENSFDQSSPKTHGGTLFRKEAFSLELQMFETDVAPYYKIYAYDEGKKLSPHKFAANVLLKRLGGDVQHLSFSPVGDFLISDNEVREPHSFDLEINAEYNDRKYLWSYQSYEARTQIEQKVAKRSGIEWRLSK